MKVAKGGETTSFRASCFYEGVSGVYLPHFLSPILFPSPTVVLPFRLSLPRPAHPDSLAALLLSLTAVSATNEE